MVEHNRDVGERPRRELYNVPRVALMLDVRESFIRSLVARREIPFFKIGKFIRFDPNEIGLWLETHRADGLR